MPTPTKVTMVCPQRKWLIFVEKDDGTVDLFCATNCYDARMRVIREGIDPSLIETIAQPAWETKLRPLLARAWQLLVAALAEPAPKVDRVAEAKLRLSK